MCDLTFLEVTCDCCACSFLTNDSPSPEPKFALLRSALSYIETEGSVDSLIWVGAAIHKETAGCEDGLSLFDSWSRKRSDYGPEQTRRIWLSFNHDRPRSANLQALRREFEAADIGWDQVISKAQDPFFWMDVEVEDCFQ
jgi:hypothetical protein